MIKDHQDAFGHLIMDYHLGKRPREVIERDDGYIDTSYGPDGYFQEYDNWSEGSKEALKLAKGRILDVGCGAGRVALHFQNAGYDIVGIDNSPLAVEVCKQRGVKDVRLMSVTQVSRRLGPFDTIVMCGNNLALLGSRQRAKWLLRRFYSITSKDGIIIGQILDPHQTTSIHHLRYHDFNTKRGRMPGQVRIRVRHQNYKSPWFDYLFLSKDELRGVIAGTGWTARQFIDQEVAGDSGISGVYWAILCKGNGH